MSWNFNCSYVARSSLAYIPCFFCEIFLSADIYRLCKLDIFWHCIYIALYSTSILWQSVVGGNRRKALTNLRHDVVSNTSDLGGWRTRRTPHPKIEKNKIFWRKIVIFSHEIPQKFSCLPLLGAMAMIVWLFTNLLIGFTSTYTISVWHHYTCSLLEQDMVSGHIWLPLSNFEIHAQGQGP
jgi:hypothetical protein